MLSTVTVFVIVSEIVSKFFKIEKKLLVFCFFLCSTLCINKITTYLLSLKILFAFYFLQNSICFFADVTQNFDYVFWSGDLNFRLASPRAKVLEWLSKTQFPLPAHLPHGYLHHDQLCSVLSEGAAFKGFQEANITFPPTYKVSSKQKLIYCGHNTY